MLPKNKRRRTTDSNHPYRKYPNLVQGVTAMYANHIWAADITYVWIYGNVLYLHLITDVYSHAVIGWCLSETMEAINTKEALLMAVKAAEEATSAERYTTLTEVRNTPATYMLKLLCATISGLV
ncbi:DDE-type integrase/transposase/recombinase [Prevotella corporis]|nr:DDE-type integrase/transposase/recombinase [Prevotella corporis]